MTPERITAELLERLRRDSNLEPAELAVLADKFREAVYSQGVITEHRERALQAIGDSRAVLVFAAATYAIALLTGIVGYAASLLPYNPLSILPGAAQPLAVYCWLFGLPFGALGILIAWMATGRLKRVFQETAPR